MRFSAILLGAFTYQVGSSVAETLVRQSSFWSAKNIFISVLVPGSSHTTWVLEIGQELATRGHNVSFLCDTDGAKYARDYPNINILSMGEPDFSLADTDMIEISARKDDQVESTKMFFTAINAGFRKYYLQFADYIREFNPDLMICDFLTDSCSHAADKHDIPFIVTSTAAAFPDASAPFLNSVFLGEPTTEPQSIWTRFYNKYISDFLVISKLGSLVKETVNIRKELGISSADGVFSGKLGDSVKLINNFFGLEPARAVGPLIKFVGPIMPSNYPQMDPDTLHFVNLHKRVAYIAFGHHATPSKGEFTKLLTALVDSVEEGSIDAFLWATVKISDFPQTVTSSKGTNLNLTDILQNPSSYPHFRFVKWAPQFAILSHPSTSLFISHGGANSIYESLYNGKKMLIHPFFADQPNNGKVLRSAGVALVNDRHRLSVADIAQNIRLLVEDKNGTYEKNLARMSALAQLKAADAIPRAVSAVEEVLFTSHKDDIPHLYPASRNMSYIKANNIDLQFLLATVVGTVIVVLLGIFYKLTRCILSVIRPRKKTKSE